MKPLSARRRAPATTAAVLVMAALGAACGPSTPSSDTEAIRASTPAPTSASRAAAPVVEPAIEPVALAPEVELKEPVIEVVPPEAADGDLWAALTAEGVDTLTALRVFEAQMVTVEADHDVTVAAVDGQAFRPFTPESTAQAPQVWQRLHAGEALVRHDVAHELGLELGGKILLLTDRGNVELRVGAFASNGAPPVADIVVPWHVGTTLGKPEVNRLLVAVEPEASLRTVRKAVTDALGGGTATIRETPSQQKAQLFAGGGNVTIEPFQYRDNGDGTITIDPGWVSRWIVRVDLPLLGTTYVNRVMAPQLLAAFDELESRGLLSHFDRSQFGGGWVARHIDWNPARALSMHAWGLAIDINTRDNALGATPKMDARVVEVFDRWGFAWGGRWSRPDGMHFELAKVVTPT